jgi:hypothetical protein
VIAGEIRQVGLDKSIVLLDEADEVLGGPNLSEPKAERRRQLAEFGSRCSWAIRCTSYRQLSPGS